LEGHSLEPLKKKALIQTAACQSMVGYVFLRAIKRSKVIFLQKNQNNILQVSFFDIISNHVVFLKSSFFWQLGE